MVTLDLTTTLLVVLFYLYSKGTNAPPPPPHQMDPICFILLWKINLIVYLSFAFNRLISWGPPWLNGFVCVSHPAAPGSDSKHIIYSVSVLNGFVKLMLLSAFEFWKWTEKWKLKEIWTIVSYLLFSSTFQSQLNLF